MALKPLGVQAGRRINSLETVDALTVSAQAKTALAASTIGATADFVLVVYKE
jgi:hypothetical protein